jgi:hypothetical protein
VAHKVVQHAAFCGVLSVVQQSLLARFLFWIGYCSCSLGTCRFWIVTFVSTPFRPMLLALSSCGSTGTLTSAGNVSPTAGTY